jgi:hypothetical protein
LLKIFNSSLLGRTRNSLEQCFMSDLGKTKLYFEFHDKEINFEIGIGIFYFLFSFFSSVFSAAKRRDGLERIRK